jgi:hypothetical protein
MANHCYNGIVFHGKDLTKIKSMLAEAVEVNKTEGWLPKSIDVSKMSYVHHLFDVDIVDDEGEDKVFINCWTKWSPPLDELEHICREAQVSCSCSYDESGMELYGESEYNLETDCTTNVYLTDEEVNRVQYDEENDCYLWDGNFVESDSDAYQEMLDEKLNNKDF